MTKMPREDLPEWHESALLLLGHGSTTNAQSSVPTKRHAETLRGQGHFAEVLTAFWKEAPFFNEILEQVTAKYVYVVPNFISEGYYTKNIIPRELKMTGRLSEVDWHRLMYCDPVGKHH